MSLVNQVLRDLEKNNQPTKPLQFQVVKSPENKKFWLMIGSMFFIVFVVIIYLFYSKINQIKNVYAEAENISYQSKKNIFAIKNDLNKQAVSKKIKKNEFIIKKEKKHLLKNIENKLQGITLIKKPIKKTTKKNYKKLSSQLPFEKKLFQSTTKNITNLAEVKKQSQETQLRKKLKEIKIKSQINGLIKTQALLIDLIHQNPSFHAARLFLVKICNQIKHCNTLEILSKALENYPNYTQYRFMLAKYLFKKNEFSTAEKYLTDLSGQYNHHIDLIQMRALIRQKLKKHQLAIIDYSSILKKRPERGDIYLAIGISFDALGLREKAKRSFQNALSDRRLSERQQQFAENKIISYQG